MHFRLVQNAHRVPRTICRSVGTQAGAPLRKKVTTKDVTAMHRKGTRITMCTAYDYPSAFHVDAAGIDVLLVGDSLGMVQLGHDTTLPVTMDTMIAHAQAVSRAANSALLVGDMPFGSYEVSVEEAVRNAVRFLKEAGMDVVKMEGASPRRLAAVRATVEAGVGVMGHIGLTPQSISVLGGFRAQGKSLRAAQQLLAEAKALEEAGCFAIVIECVPEQVAAWVTTQVGVPTIGIGSGAGTSGQVLVYHDLLGMMEHEHHAKVAPRFCKQYARVGDVIQQALGAYRDEVREGAFPSETHSPYRMTPKQAALFETALAEADARGTGDKAGGVRAAGHGGEDGDEAIESPY